MKSRNRKQKRVTSNARIDVAPAGGNLASLGRYTKPVECAWQKWRGKVPEDDLERYFFAVAMAVLYRETKLALPAIVSPEHWPAVFELGTAVASVSADKSKPTAWLIGNPRIHVATNGRWEKWPAIARQIEERGGPRFTPAALAKRAERLKMLTPAAVASEYYQFRAAKTRAVQ